MALVISVASQVNVPTFTPGSAASADPAARAAARETPIAMVFMVSSRFGTAPISALHPKNVWRRPPFRPGPGRGILRVRHNRHIAGAMQDAEHPGAGGGEMGASDAPGKPHARALPGYLAERYRGWRASRFEENRAWYARLAADGQHPRAMVIQCCDSRINVAEMFGAEPGDL